MKTNRTLATLLLALVLGLPAAVPAGAQSIEIPLSFLLGTLTGSLTVSFESVTNLNSSNLGVSAQLVSPLDPGLLARLPANVSIPVAFPVLVRIEPPVQGGLSFHGVATVDLLGLNLPLTDLPLRLYSAPLGGTFLDRTTGPNNRSYRAIGSTGGFSEFLLVVDLTALNQVITGKLDNLDLILATNSAAIPGALVTQLSAALAAVRADYNQGNTAAAIQDLDLFLTTVEQNSGTDIPDLWRSARDVVDVAGLLRAGGETLEYSLKQVP